jgi:hypothetical protein
MPEDEPLLDLSKSRSQVVASAAGCWSFVHPAQVIRDVMSDTSVLRLDTGFYRGSTQNLALRALPASPEQDRATKVSGWGVGERDTTRLAIWLGNGFTGVYMQVKQRADSLKGYGRYYTDFGPQWFMPHAVFARRVACPR